MIKHGLVVLRVVVYGKGKPLRQAVNVQSRNRERHVTLLPLACAVVCPDAMSGQTAKERSPGLGL